MSIWTGRDDTAAEGPGAVRWHQRVQPLGEKSPPGVVLIGFACDEGVRRNGGRVGAKDGPRAIRKALANMAWHQEHPVYDAGDVLCVGEDLEGAQERLAEVVAALIRARHRPLVLGGGHETAWGTFCGIMECQPDQALAIVNIDAHFDLRSADRPNSGTPFRQMADWCTGNGQRFSYRCFGIARASNSMASFDLARELGAEWVNDCDMVEERLLGDAIEKLGNVAGKSSPMYLSLDLDVLPASVMPAVSAPAARGVPLETVEWLVRSAIWTFNLKAVDIVELNPHFDIDGHGARTAAYLAWIVGRLWNPMKLPSRENLI